ncbi:MAG: SpoIIE family protein phosphatase [Coleofasciculaceae cyanobacterium SM2_3_26]|nr:SpoIIE family protein phosphatase [Coleofasciculaceae cyanobacterium SM2_3_26]
MISRQQFLEIMSRPYGIELFSRRPLRILYPHVRSEILLFPGGARIIEAVVRCLQRPIESLYEPIVVQLDSQTYRLLDVHDLLIAHARIHELATAALDRANARIGSLNEQLKAENLRLSAELEVTRRLQQILLPKPEELAQVPDLDIAGFMEPAEEVGGDYYDVLVDKGHVKIGIGDVTGHGLESGVLMLMVQTAVRTLLESNETDPVRFLNVLNRTIYENVRRMNSDKTLTLSLLDYHDGRVRLSGQHEEVILVRQGGAIEHIDTVDLGFPLGLEADISHWIGQQSFSLYPGDVVILYTDGITEAENMKGEQYRLERLCTVASKHWQSSASQIRQVIIEDVRSHIGQQKVYDDITLVVFKQRATTPVDNQE